MSDSIDSGLRDRPVVRGVVLPEGMTRELLDELAQAVNGLEHEDETPAETAVRVYRIVARHRA